MAPDKSSGSEAQSQACELWQQDKGSAWMHKALPRPVDAKIFKKIFLICEPNLGPHWDWLKNTGARAWSGDPRDRVQEIG